MSQDGPPENHYSLTLVWNQINYSLNSGLALELTIIKPGSLWKFSSEIPCITTTRGYSFYRTIWLWSEQRLKKIALNTVYVTRTWLLSVTSRPADVSRDNSCATKRNRCQRSNARAKESRWTHLNCWHVNHDWSTIRTYKTTILFTIILILFSFFTWKMAWPFFKL